MSRAPSLEIPPSPHRKSFHNLTYMCIGSKPADCRAVTFANIQFWKNVLLLLVVITKLVCIDAILVVNVSPMALMVPSTLSNGSDGQAAYRVVFPCENRVILQSDEMRMLA